MSDTWKMITVLIIAAAFFFIGYMARSDECLIRPAAHHDAT